MKLEQLHSRLDARRLRLSSGDGAAVRGHWVQPRIVIYYPRALSGDGGVTLAVRGWAQALAAAGAEVAVLCAQESSQRLSASAPFVPIRHFGSKRYYLPRSLTKNLLGADLLILHSGWAPHNILAAREARQHNVPYLVTPHGAYNPNILRRHCLTKRLWWLLVERSFLVHAAGIHLFFKGEEADLRALGYAGPAIVAPNGISVPEEALWDGGTGRYILWFGRFDIEHKGLDILVEATARIEPAKRPKLKLYGPDQGRGRATIETLVSERGLREWISVHGPVYGSEKWGLLRRAKAFVYPCRWDSHSVAMMEAAAAGVPLLTTVSTFLGRELASLDAALAVEPVTDALAKGLLTVISQPCLDMSSRARDYVTEKYAWEATARRFLTQVNPWLEGGE